MQTLLLLALLAQAPTCDGPAMDHCRAQAQVIADNTWDGDISNARPRQAFVYLQDPEPHPRLTHVIIGAHVVSQFLDVTSTAYAMGRARERGGGFREANPFLRPIAGDPVRLALVKGTVAAATSYVFLKYHREHPIKVALAAGGLTILTSVVAARNVRVSGPRTP